MYRVTCNHCTKTTLSPWKDTKYCNRECYKNSSMVKDIGRKSGKMNKGRKIVRKPTKKRPGFHVNGDGYKLIRMNGRYVFEHRLVMEKYIGRLLEQHERVHHKNHDRLDNRIENLELVANHSEHIKKHHNKRNKDGTFR